MDDLIWLTKWVASHCNGEWEHEYGVTLESVDNPGWMLRIDLDGTGINPSHFKPVAIQRSETDWIEAKIENGAFIGGASLSNLPELLRLFRNFISPQGSHNSPPPKSPAHHSPHKSADHHRRPPHSGKPRRGGPPRGPRRG